MKKSLVALAVLAATGAYAQSSVTLYGIVEATTDIGYNRKVENNTTTTTNGVLTSTVNTRSEQKNNFRIQDGSDQGTGTSRIGFRGTEDLGGGLKAAFNLEMGLRSDDGCTTLSGTPGSPVCTNGGNSLNSGGATFGRNAWVGASGGFGEVRLGRQVLGSYGVQANSEPTGAALGLYNSSSTFYAPIGGVRFSNAIKYISPNMGGFTGNLTLSAPETGAPTSSTTTVTGTPPVTTPPTVNAASTAQRRTGVDLALEFANGPVYVGFGYNLRDTGNNTANGVGGFVNPGKVIAYTLGGSYDLGVVKPFLNYTRETTDASDNTAGVAKTGRETVRATSIGLRAPVGAFTVIAGYGRIQTSGNSASSNGDNNRNEARRNSYQLGAQYALSKRTLLEANYGQTRLENNTDSLVASTAVATSARATDRISAFNVGLKHSF